MYTLYTVINGKRVNVNAYVSYLSALEAMLNHENEYACAYYVDEPKDKQQVWN